MPRRILLVVKSSPYRTVLAGECFRIATAMIAMDVLPQLLFIDDGVYSLLKGRAHDHEQPGLPSFREHLKTLADLVGLCVAEDSLLGRNLSETDLDEHYNLKTISKEGVTNLILENETVLTF